MWGYDVSPKSIEEDDWLHKPDEKIDDTGSIWNMRGFTTLGSLGLLLLALVGLLCVILSVVLGTKLTLPLVLVILL